MEDNANMAQQYSLKWNNHQPNFISMFAILRNTQALVDVTLAAEGRHLHAHKAVLSVCSPYFHSLFVENPSQHPIVILKDITFNDLRTIVDFMYYGEVNITQDELPQMLHSAKSLKVKGLTDTEPTSVMRSQSSDFPYEQAGESGEQAAEPRSEVTGDQYRGEASNEQSQEQPHEIESQRRSITSPNNIPTAKRRRCRRPSNISASINLVSEDNRDDRPLAVVREDITLSDVAPRRREFIHGDTQQNTEPQTINIDSLNVNNNPAGMPQGGQWSMLEQTYPRYTNSCFSSAPAESSGNANAAGPSVYMGGMMVGGQALEGDLELMASLRLRRTKHLTRQTRVDGRNAPRQQRSEPAPPPPPAPAPASSPALRKHHSYPQLAAMMRRQQQQQVGSLLIRAVTVVDRRAGGAGAGCAGAAPRASHTPAVRSGPPLSCNFCWNTVDESGRILRRKTQYHCPECRTNLCIVPCFHEYHDAETELASVR